MSERRANADAVTSQRGRLVVISGPSGSGKTTVCRRLIDDPHVVLSVSATTRTARPDEVDGVHYHFLPREEFLRRVGRGEFTEHAEYNGHLYGTPRQPLEAALAAGRTVLLDIDVQGAAQLRPLYPDAVYIFLDAPDRREARARLDRRNTEAPDERRRRLAAGERERAAGDERFDHRVVNDDLDDTVARIRVLISASASGGHPS